MGLNLILFKISIGIKRRIWILAKIKFFTICKRFENLKKIVHSHSKFAKSFELAKNLTKNKVG
jgi:hypothetical protein